MKIRCQCGDVIFDITDYLPHKAHIIPDQEWFDLLEAIDAAIEKSGPTAKDKEDACMKIRTLIGALSRESWQCSACGRIYIDDWAYSMHELIPDNEGVPRELFRSRYAPH